jgi:K+-sensing histidine kinase KdpD
MAVSLSRSRKCDRERLFERYSRGANVSGIVGMGVGLYLVKTVVDLHGGDISVESEEDQGSRFTVRIPVSPPRRAETLSEQPRITAGAESTASE